VTLWWKNGDEIAGAGPLPGPFTGDERAGEAPCDMARCSERGVVAGYQPNHGWRILCRSCLDYHRAFMDKAGWPLTFVLLPPPGPGPVTP
jgi:hypothetical protein